MRRTMLMTIWGWVGVVAWAGSAAAQPGVEKARDVMVETEIIAAGIKNERVIDSIRKTPRHEFVPVNLRDKAYLDMALPIGEQQTISPPFVVAYMTEALDPQPEDKVLEIGTGSGYQAAVLSPLVKEVYSIEIVEKLGRNAEKVLKKLKYPNVYTKVGDGFLGWPDKGPFNKIIVTCSPEDIPKPLIEQLAEGGVMVIPLGERYQQSLYSVKKEKGKLVPQPLQPTLFVPMTGRAEKLREVQPDPLNPAVVNGSFEKVIEDPKRDEKAPVLPLNWHYFRYGTIEEDKLAPEGTHYVTFHNDVPGRIAHATQGFAVDGRKIKELAAAVHVRLKDVRAGQRPDQLAILHISYYDDQRALVGEDWLGPWFGTFDWTPKSGVLKVPPHARAAIVQVGLLGGTGEASFDWVRLEAVKGK